MEVPVPGRRLVVEATAVDPGRVLRRSLVGWGLGHLMLGDARGWLLLGLEIAWLVAFGLSLALLQTDRWLVAYGLLSGFIVAWVAQAVNAYRKARARSGTNSGAAWLLAVAPFVIALLTGFWLFSGAEASPAATFQRYVGAWRHDDAEARRSACSRNRHGRRRSRIGGRSRSASSPTASTPSPMRIPSSAWTRRTRTPTCASTCTTGVTDGGAGPVQFDVQVVRQVSVPSTFFGLVPATRTETRIVDTVGSATLIRRPVDGLLAASGASVWLIQQVAFTRRTLSAPFCHEDSYAFPTRSLDNVIVRVLVSPACHIALGALREMPPSPRPSRAERMAIRQETRDVPGRDPSRPVYVISVAAELVRVHSADPPHLRGGGPALSGAHPHQHPPVFGDRHPPRPVDPAPDPEPGREPCRGARPL